MARPRTPWLLCSALLALAPAVRAEDPPAAAGALATYVRRAQPSYGWREERVDALGPATRLFRLALVSQRWQGRDWAHRLLVVVPAPASGERARPGHGVLVISGSGGEQRNLDVVVPLAERLGVPVAVLLDVPNQPLYPEASADGKGLKEDALIAHTFTRYLESGDIEQVALLPMVRSAVAALDALGEFSARLASQPEWGFARLDRWVVTGASKRGWTTWLTGAIDPRVQAIAPIVFDNLNMREQLALHMRVWGEPSPSIHDYTERGLVGLLRDPRADALLRVVDPYSYAAALALPKLQMIATNDSYWPLEAIHLYRGGLPGELDVHYVPNAGHRAGISVVFALAGFFDAVTGRTPPLPEVRVSVLPARRRAVLELRARGPATPEVRGLKLWSTQVPRRDFREASWETTAAQQVAPGRWEAPLPATGQEVGSAAFLGEVELRDSSGGTYSMHSPVQVWEQGPAEKK